MWPVVVVARRPPDVCGRVLRGEPHAGPWDTDHTCSGASGSPVTFQGLVPLLCHMRDWVRGPSGHTWCERPRTILSLNWSQSQCLHCYSANEDYIQQGMGKVLEKQTTSLAKEAC